MMAKMAIYHNVIAPYKVPFFEGIARNFNGDIILITSSMLRQKRKEWGIQKIDAPNIKIKYLPAINSRFLGLWYNPGILRQILTTDFDGLMTGDYMFLSAMLSLIAARLKRKPVLLYTVATKPINLRSELKVAQLPFSSYLYKLVRLQPLVRATLPRYDLYVGPSKTTVKHLIRQGIQPEKISLIPNPVDLDKFSPRKPDEHWKLKLNLNAEDLLITYVGRLTKYKGISFLIKAFRRLTTKYDNLKLCLVGEGDFESELVSLARKLGVGSKVTFVGYKNHSEIPLIHSVTDIFVLPSYPSESNVEQFPNALLEAMASGIPPVCFDIEGGIKDIVKNGETGIKASNIDHKSLADAIEQLVTDSTKRQIIGYNARKNIERNFSPESVGKEYVNLFQKLLKVRNPG